MKIYTSKIAQGITIVMLLLSQIVLSQQPQRNNKQTPETLAQSMTLRMLQALELSEDQVVKVFAINKTYAEQMAALRKEKSRDRDRYKEVTETHRNSLKKVLTKAQFTKYKKLMTQRNQNRNKRSRRGKRRRYN